MLSLREKLTPTLDENAMEINWKTLYFIDARVTTEEGAVSSTTREKQATKSHPTKRLAPPQPQEPLRHQYLFSLTTEPVEVVATGRGNLAFTRHVRKV